MICLTFIHRWPGTSGHGRIWMHHVQLATSLRRIVSFALLCTLLTFTAAAATPAANVYSSAGPCRVATLELDWQDATRNRTIPARIYYPVTTNPALCGHLALNRIGISGHAFGGFTTLASAGQTFLLPTGKTQNLGETKAADRTWLTHGEFADFLANDGVFECKNP